jgi:hypothetical protein
LALGLILGHKVPRMKAYSWIPLGLLAFACSGSAFTSDGADGGQGAEGGSESGASAGGASSKAGSGNGGAHSAGSGGKGGSANKGGSTGQGGSLSVGGNLGIGGDLVAGGNPPVAGTGSTAGTGTAGTSSAGTNTGGTGNPDPIDKVCPKAQPTAGAGCLGDLVCTYTSDVRPACRPYAKCENNKWAITKPQCDALNACPALQVGKACDAQVHKPCMLSAEQGIYCICTGCNGATGACSTDTVWACAASAGGVGCPTLPPNLGQSCAGEVQCGYGSCTTSNAISARCNGSEWDWELLACPL